MTKILVTNDDGIQTTGIARLAEAMQPLGDVYVVAPDREMSGISHALSILRPLHVKEIRQGWFAVSGTPTDCVYLGFHSLVGRDIDLVVSGINKGPNLGEDVHYSGTVAGAVEGCILGKPAIAFSQIDSNDESLARAASFAHDLAKEVLERPEESNILLNVNFPADKPKGVRLTRLGKRYYEDTLTETIESGSTRTFVIAGTAVHYEQEQDTDCQVAEDGYITVTPMHLDLSNFEQQVKMASWNFFKEKQ